MRPVDADAVANLAAEQFVHRHAQTLGLGVEQRVLDRAHRQRYDSTGRRSRRASEFGVDALVCAHVLPDHARREPRDHRADPRRAEAFVEFAPADDAGIRGQLDVVVVAPARVAGQRFDGSDFHGFLPDCRGAPSSHWHGLMIPACSRRHAVTIVTVVTTGW